MDGRLWGCKCVGRELQWSKVCLHRSTLAVGIPHERGFLAVLIFHKCLLLFRQGKLGESFFPQLLILFVSTQSMPYSQVVYFQGACSDPLYLFFYLIFNQILKWIYLVWGFILIILQMLILLILTLWDRDDCHYPHFSVGNRHTEAKWWSQDSNPSSLPPDSMFCF